MGLQSSTSSSSAKRRFGDAQTSLPLYQVCLPMTAKLLFGLVGRDGLRASDLDECQAPLALPSGWQVICVEY